MAFIVWAIRKISQKSGRVPQLRNDPKLQIALATGTLSTAKRGQHSRMLERILKVQVGKSRISGPVTTTGHVHAVVCSVLKIELSEMPRYCEEQVYFNPIYPMLLDPGLKPMHMLNSRQKMIEPFVDYFIVFCLQRRSALRHISQTTDLHDWLPGGVPKYVYFLLVPEQVGLFHHQFLPNN